MDDKDTVIRLDLSKLLVDTLKHSMGKKSSQDTNNWQSAQWQWRQWSVRFSARFKPRPSTSSFRAQKCNHGTLITLMLTAPAKRFTVRYEGCLWTRSQFSCDNQHLVWCLCMAVCKMFVQPGGECSPITNHSFTYKTQSEKSIQISTIKSHRSIYGMTKRDLLCIHEISTTINNTRDQYSHKIRLSRPSHTNMQG